jgi:deoxypyrimidine-specific 5' nucleotidase type C protein (NT5C)
MRIGIDLDGCGYNVVAAHRKSCVYRGVPVEQLPEVTQWNYWNDWNMTFEEWKESADAAVDLHGCFATGVPMTGFVEALATFKHEGHTVHIVTNRTWGEYPVSATEEWLKTYKVPFDSLTFAADKTLIPCHIFVEDNVDNLAALRSAGVVAIAYDQLWNQEWQGLRAYGWDDITVLVRNLHINSERATNTNFIPLPVSVFERMNEPIRGIS